MTSPHRGRQIPAHVCAALFAAAIVLGFAISVAGQSTSPQQSDAYSKAYGGWERRPLEKARKSGKLVFQSDFSSAGLAHDWTADGAAVEPRNGGALIALSPARAAAGRKYGVLWSRIAFAQPLMIEAEFTFDPSTLHDANIFWGQKQPAADELGKDQDCFILSCFGWGGRGCGFESAKGGAYGITAAVAPQAKKRYSGIWIIDGSVQCLYLDGVLLVYTQSPSSPPASGLLGLSVFQSSVEFHSIKVYALGREP